MTRLLPDPIPASGGMLTASELESVRSVLKRLASRPAQGLSVAAWPPPSQAAFRSLHAAGYVAEWGESVLWRRGFRQSTYRITDAGREYLRQIGEAPVALGLVAREALEP